MDTPPPLTKARKKNGYQRRPQVVAELADMEGLPMSEWSREAHRCKEETLCTLARRALAKGRYDVFGDLVNAHLHPRAMVIAHDKCRGMSDIDTQEVVEKTINAINEDLIREDVERARYCEISFGHFVARKALTAAGRLRKKRSKEAPLESDLDEVPINNAQAMVAMKRALDRSEDLHMAIAKVVPKFSSDQQLAFDLWFNFDMQIESKGDPQSCIAGILGVDKRTVHNWLTKICKALRAEIGESK